MAATLEDIVNMLHSEKHRSRKRRVLGITGVCFADDAASQGDLSASEKNVAASRRLMRESRLS